jgi:hypothetical protein
MKQQKDGKKYVVRGSMNCPLNEILPYLVDSNKEGGVGIAYNRQNMNEK